LVGPDAGVGANLHREKLDQEFAFRLLIDDGKIVGIKGYRTVARGPRSRRAAGVGDASFALLLGVFAGSGCWGVGNCSWAAGLQPTPTGRPLWGERGTAAPSFARG
jgi:hypothetical protein